MTRQRLRILQIIGSMHIGGAEQAVVNIARGLDKARFEVALCCTLEQGILAEQLAVEGIEVMLAAPRSRLFRHATSFWVHRAVRRWKPDVVHTHGTPSLLHAGPLGVAHLLPKWIHTFHYGNYPFGLGRYLKLERRLCTFAAQLVAVSDSQRKAIIQCHGIAPEDIKTVANGVADNPYLDDLSARKQARTEFGFEDDQLVVGCIAVLSEQKGISFLLRAAREISQVRVDVRFLVVGGGPLESRLRSEARELGLGSKVVFTGWRADNLRLLQALDIFVMSSLWEAMPLALIEAMAARRTIVVTDVGENRRIVDGGACGVVIPPKNSREIVSAIKILADHEQLRCELAARAHAAFKTRYTTTRMVQAYEELYLADSTAAKKIIASREVPGGPPRIQQKTRISGQRKE